MMNNKPKKPPLKPKVAYSILNYDPKCNYPIY